jgi:hypothetical protein
MHIPRRNSRFFIRNMDYIMLQNMPMDGHWDDINPVNSREDVAW